MALDVKLLRDSFELVLAREPELTRRFYEILFERYPQAKALFGRNSARNQEAMLAQALLAVVEHLEDPEWLKTTLGAMGRKHVDYGVTPEMYPWVGDSLLRTLANAAGPHWTPQLAEAWGAAYSAISQLMLAGAVTEPA